MKAPVPRVRNASRHTPTTSVPRLASSAPRSVADVLAPLDQIAATSPSLIVNHGATFSIEDETWELPRYVFIGPKGGDEPLRVGLFAGIHGDEPEGVHALVSFLRLLERVPDVATGYCLFIYPICNPTGFARRTRFSRSGKDLNREFWSGSAEPEIGILESELTNHSLQGIISLHTDSTSHGFYGFAQGAMLTRNLIEPALAAAEEYLPRNQDEQIDGFEARHGIIRGIYPGVLSAPPRVRPRPFEIILETPEAAPAYLKEAAFVAAMQTILTRYQEFISYAANL